MNVPERPVWAEVDLAAISANVAMLRERAGVDVCAVVKADGYGHGAVPVAKAALRGGASMLAVALVAEGSELRNAGIDARVAVLSQASPGELGELVARRLDATVYTDSGVDALAALAESAGRGPADPVGVHLKVDTGMRRVGARPAEVVDIARSIQKSHALRLDSVFTHFAVADEPSYPFTAEQTSRYREVLARLEEAGVTVPVRHAANTAGAIAHPDARFDMVRLGIGIYGLDPGPEVRGLVPFRPAMSLRARVSHVKRIEAGERVSYGLRFAATRQTTIATVPLGYADGVTRSLGATGGEVLIGGRRHPIAGTVTMDQLMVDCGDEPVEVGDEVVLFGRQGDEVLSVDEWADRVGTINYEIVCGISPRVPRRYREAEDAP
ncbi:MAG: alanine racemase [Acidimicrobiales bacterium]|nr:alanine racemase [Acidimicrobiales bacterium]